MAPVKVLVADDNVDHRFLIVRALRELHDQELEVETANDGEEALDAVYCRGRYAGGTVPQLILLDIKMPKLDGLEVLQQIKTDERVRKIPVVVLTSSERPEDIDTTYRLGGNCYVTKVSGRHSLPDTLRGVAQYWTTLASSPSVVDAS